MDEMAVLKELLEGITYRCVKGNVDTGITELVYDSRKIVKGCLFVCIKGANFDGHEFIKEAVEKGAAALVVSDPVQADGEVTVIQTEDTRYALAFLSAAFFGHPAKRLKVIGIKIGRASCRERV